MPAPVLQPRVRAGQEIRGFLGVNLRKDRLSLADEELAKSINADLHTQIGVIALRGGRDALFASPLGDTEIRRVARINGHRYQVAGLSVYRDQTFLYSGLAAEQVTTLAPFRPLNDSTVWAFVADGAMMKKDDGTTTQGWGIVAPTTAPTVTATGTGDLTGVYRIRYTYVRRVGQSIAHESNPSPASASVTAASQYLQVSDLVMPTDTQVTHVRLYRTLAGGTDFFADDLFPVPSTSGTSTRTDILLGALLETDNPPPPVAGWVEEFQEHLFLCRDPDNPHYLWYTKRFRPESVPTDQFLEIGNPDDPLQCARKLVGLLAVLSRRTKYRVTGTATAGFVAYEALSQRGTPAPLAAISTERGLVFVARDGVFLSNLIGPDEPLAAMIEPLFYGEDVNDIERINWDAAGTMAAASWKNRYYVSLPTGGATTPDVVAVYSADTRHWYFYDHPVRSFTVEEDLDQLTAGHTDGFVYVLERGSAGDAGADIALDVETKDYFGQAVNVRKLFLWARVDADALDESITASLIVDGVVKRTATITGTRTRRLLPLPEGAMGATWRVRLQYTGVQRVKIYGVAMIWLPLEPS